VRGVKRSTSPARLHDAPIGKREPPILELLDIDEETLLEVRTDGEALIIRPSRKDKKSRVRDAGLLTSAGRIDRSATAAELRRVARGD